MFLLSMLSVCVNNSVFEKGYRRSLLENWFYFNARLLLRLKLPLFIRACAKGLSVIELYWYTKVIFDYRSLSLTLM